MAVNSSLPSATDLSTLVWKSMPPEMLNNFTFILTVAKAAGIVFLIYIVFLIVQSIIKTRQALRIKAIEQTLNEINHKMDLLVGHKKSK